MDFQELKNKPVAELMELLAETEGELHALRLKAMSKSLKEVHKVKTARKLIARINMLLMIKQTKK